MDGNAVGWGCGAPIYTDINLAGEAMVLIFDLPGMDTSNQTDFVLSSLTFGNGTSAELYTRAIIACLVMFH